MKLLCATFMSHLHKIFSNSIVPGSPLSGCAWRSKQASGRLTSWTRGEPAELGLPGGERRGLHLEWRKWSLGMQSSALLAHQSWNCVVHSGKPARPLAVRLGGRQVMEADALPTLPPLSPFHGPSACNLNHHATVPSLRSR